MFRIIGNDSSSRIDFDVPERSEFFSTITKFVEEMRSMKRVIIERSFIMVYVRRVACSMEKFESFVYSLHVSKPLSTGTQVYVMNSHMSRNQKSYYEYAMRTMNEFGLRYLFVHDFVYNGEDMFGGSYNLMRGTICYGKTLVRKDEAEEDKPAIHPIAMISYYNLLKYCILLFCISFVVLVLEIIVWIFGKIFK